MVPVQALLGGSWVRERACGAWCWRMQAYNVADSDSHAGAGVAIADLAFSNDSVPDYIQPNHAKPSNAVAHDAIADCNAHNSNSCTA